MSSAIRTKPAAALIGLSMGVIAMGALSASTARAQAAPAAEPAAALDTAPDWRFADPAADLIGGIDVQAVLQSPFVKFALDQGAAKAGGTVPGLEPTLKLMRGVSQIYFSTSGRDQDTGLLVMMRGSLNDAAATALLQGARIAGGKPSKPGETRKLGPPDIEMRRVDAATVLFGDAARLDAAVERLRGPASATPSPLAARAKELSAGNDVWIGGTFPNIPAVAMLSASIRGMAFGLSLREGFRLQASVDMTTPELAQAVEAIAKKSVADAQRQNNINVQPEIEVAGSTVRVKVAMTQDQFLKMVQEQIAASGPTAGSLFGPAFGASSGASSGNGAPQPTSVQAQPVQPQKPPTVKIYGLDDGPKEVPLSKP